MGSAERIPSPGIDSDQFEASSTEDAADDEMKAAKAADGAADAVVDSPTEEAAAEDKAEEVQQEATEETKEQNEREIEIEWMNRARSECSDGDWLGEPCDTEEARAIAELVCEATRAGTTTHCFVGAKRQLEAEQAPEAKPKEAAKEAPKEDEEGEPTDEEGEPTDEEGEPTDETSWHLVNGPARGSRDDPAPRTAPGPEVEPLLTLECFKAMCSLYLVLGCEPSATTRAMRKAYHRRCLRYHPDKGGDPETFKFIHFAFETLSKRTTRTRYNDLGHAAFMKVYGGAFAEAGAGSGDADGAGVDSTPPVTHTFTEWINITAMKEAQNLQAMRTLMVNDVSWAEITQIYIDKAEKEGAFGCFKTQWGEHARSVKLGRPGRLYNRSQGKLDGASAFGLPKVLLSLFRLGLPVFNLDMVSSHYKGIMELLELWGDSKVSGERTSQKNEFSPPGRKTPQGWFLAPKDLFCV